MLLQLLVIVFFHVAHGLLSVRGSLGSATVHRSDLRLAAAASALARPENLLDENLEYMESMRIIDSAAVSGCPSDELFDAVRYIDRNANKLLYPTEESKNELWDRCKGALESRHAIACIRGAHTDNVSPLRELETPTSDRRGQVHGLQTSASVRLCHDR